MPTLIVWGLKDIFFDKKWAYWLKDTIPGAKRVVEVEDGRLFFPEDRPDTLTVPMLEFGMSFPGVNWRHAIACLTVYG